MSQTKLDQKSINNIVSTVLTDEANSLLAARDRVSDSIRKTAEVIINHSGKIVICGLGKSGLIGQKIVATLCSTGTQAVFLHAAEALHGDLGIYQKYVEKTRFPSPNRSPFELKIMFFFSKCSKKMCESF